MIYMHAEGAHQPARATYTQTVSGVICVSAYLRTLRQSLVPRIYAEDIDELLRLGRDYEPTKTDSMTPEEDVPRI
jgi:hypothetical protein